MKLLLGVLVAALLAVGLPTHNASANTIPLNGVPKYDPNPKITFTIAQTFTTTGDYGESYPFQVTKPAKLASGITGDPPGSITLGSHLYDKDGKSVSPGSILKPNVTYWLEVKGTVVSPPASFKGTITLTATPLPGAWLFFATALAGLGTVARCRGRIGAPL